MERTESISTWNRLATARSYPVGVSRRTPVPKSYPFVLAVGLLISIASSSFAQTGDVVISSNTTWAAGQYTLNSLTVTNGATLTLQGADTTGQVDGQWQGYRGDHHSRHRAGRRR